MATIDFSTAMTAMTNRSLMTVRQELQFLRDSSVITPEKYLLILSHLPEQTQLNVQMSTSREETGFTAPAGSLDNMTLNEKSREQLSYSTLAPPPSYTSPPPILCMASALYEYTPTDAGDLALKSEDRIQVLEHMNNDWWRGRNERTNLEGIFPRSYVRVIDDKPTILSPQPTSYGNMPLEVANGGQRKPSKFEENGKKFGKKMGNAAIFGAGATIGSNIVNGIF